MTVQMCVLLWARAGAEEALAAYEDKVLALLPDHGGRVVQRARVTGVGGGQPTEIQLLEVKSQAGIDSFMVDVRRTALAAERDAAIERTEIYQVELS